MANDSDFFPSSLKKVTLACFIMLTVAAVGAYIVSPKLVLDTARFEQVDQLEDQTDFLSQHISPVQSSQAATLPLASTTNPPTQSQSSSSASSIQSQIEVDAQLHQSTSQADTQQSLQNVNTQASTNQNQHCQFSTGDKPVIMGIIFDGQHIFITPQQQLYKTLHRLLNHQTDIRWFCTEDQARQAGWRDGVKSDFQLFRKSR